MADVGRETSRGHGGEAVANPKRMMAVSSIGQGELPGLEGLPTVVGAVDDGCVTTAGVKQGVVSVVLCWRRRRRFLEEELEGAMLL